MWDHVTDNLLLILLAVFLVFLNAFFVAAEFALVKMRQSRIKVLIGENRMFARTGEWLLNHLANSLS
ncbi:MAG: CNNM domain-containing protein, partial [Planctomycetota bacterium]